MTSPPTGLLHIVYFWLKPKLSEADTIDFVNGLQQLKNVDVVRQFAIGPPAKTEARGVVDNSFSFMLLLEFANETDQKTYQDHPIHLQFVAEQEDKWERVRVRDSVVL